MKYVLQLWLPVLALMAAGGAYIGIPLLIWGATGAIVAFAVFVVAWFVSMTCRWVGDAKEMERLKEQKDWWNSNP
jgi:hypothetical protein